MEGQNIESEKEILTETSCLNLVAKVLISGSDYSHVDGNQAVTPDAHNPSLSRTLRSLAWTLRVVEPISSRKIVPL